MYTNADCYINKRDEFKCIVASLSTKPQVLVITEVNNKNQKKNFYLSELQIPGYVLYHNIEFKGERGIAVYVDSETTSEQIYVMESKVESVTIKIKLGKK